MRARALALLSLRLLAFGLLAFGLLSLACGCSAASPVLGTGRTTPERRTDLGYGGAIRLPLDALDPPAPSPGLPPTSEQALARMVQPSGAVPVAWARHGLMPDLELGLMASSSMLRLSLRGQLDLDRSGLLHLLIGVSPFAGGYLAEEDPGSELGAAYRVGAELPILLGIEIFSLYELWIGARIGVEHAGGKIGESASGAEVGAAATALRTGGVVGLSVGFRRVQLLVELAVDHELWIGALGEEAIELSGVVLTPAFALRIRL